MSTTRFILPSQIAKPTAFLAPLPPEDAGFPLTNTKRGSFYVLWSCPTGSFDVTAYLDLGSPRSIVAHGLIGFDSQDPSTGAYFPNQYVASYGSTNPPSNALATVSVTGLRNSATVLPAPVVARYWSFHLSPNVGAGFTLSQFLLATGMLDLGIAYSPGAQRRPMRQRTRTETVMGTPVVNETGRPRTRWTMHFNGITAATLAMLESAFSASPVLMLDAQDRALWVDFIDDALDITHAFGPPDLFDVTANVESFA